MSAVGEMIVMGPLAKQQYMIRNHKAEVVVNYEEGNVTVGAYGFRQTYLLDEYTNFDGTMEEFAESKIYPD